MSADDVAAVREALESPTLPRAFLLAEALAALDRIAARLQEAESERDEFIASGEMEMRKRLAAEAREAALRGALAAASHPGFDDKAGNDAGNREQVWCRACAAHHQKRSHCPVLQSIARAALAADGKQS